MGGRGKILIQRVGEKTTDNDLRRQYEKHEEKTSGMVRGQEIERICSEAVLIVYRHLPTEVKEQSLLAKWSFNHF